MNSPEKFAASLVALALVRNGYSTYKDAPVDGHLRADVLVVRPSGTQAEDSFIVEVKAVRGRAAIPRRLEDLRTHYRTAFGQTVFLAFFVDTENVLIVDAELSERMRFADEEVRLDVLPASALAAGTQA